MNGYAQCRELTIECSNTKLPNPSQLPNFWNINKASLFLFMNQCLYGVHGTVTDSITGEPIEATITVIGHDDGFSTVESHLPVGDFHRPIKGGSYEFVISKDGYCPKIVEVSVADYETVNLDVQLVPGNCLMPIFSASTTQVSLGGSVNFTDSSFGDIVAWEWTFEGGTPNTSTQQNPNGIVYNEVGDFDVTLTITDADGNSETLTREDYIQVRESYNMHNGTIETCNALFYDNGGPNNNYNNNRNYTLTIKPAIEGNMIRVNFVEFSTEPDYDFLYVYDGSSTNATLIGQYDGNEGPGEVTATNEEGALTFRFTSDQAVNSPGWVATVTCISESSLNIEVNADPDVIDEGESMPYLKCVTSFTVDSFARWLKYKAGLPAGTLPEEMVDGIPAAARYLFDIVPPASVDTNGMPVCRIYIDQNGSPYLQFAERKYPDEWNTKFTILGSPDVADWSDPDEYEVEDDGSCVTGIDPAVGHMFFRYRMHLD